MGIFFISVVFIFSRLVFYTRAAGQPSFVHFNEPKSFESPDVRAQQVAKRVVQIAVLSVFGLIFLVILFSVFSGANETDTALDDDIPYEYQTALQQNPTDVNALTNIGNQYYQLGRYDSAIAYYDRVIQIDSKNAAALFNKGLIYYDQQQYDQSVAVLKMCVAAHTDHGEAYLILGHNFYDRQREEEAFKWYMKAYESGVKNAYLNHVIAYLFDKKGNISRAMEFYKEALNLDSTRADIYLRLAELEPENATRYTTLEARWKNQ